MTQEQEQPNAIDEVRVGRDRMKQSFNFKLGGRVFSVQPVTGDPCSTPINMEDVEIVRDANGDISHVSISGESAERIKPFTQQQPLSVGYVIQQTPEE